MNIVKKGWSDIRQIFRITKIFFRMNTANSMEQLGFSQKKQVLISFIVFPVSFTVLAWFGTLVVVPPDPTKPVIPAYFGSGLNLTVFCVFLMFLFSVVIRFFVAAEFFQNQNKTIATLIYSSPISAPKLALGAILSGVMLEWWYYAATLEFFFMYHLIAGLPISLFAIFLLLFLILAVSLSGACFGFYLRYILSDRSNALLTKRLFLVTVLFLVYMVLAPILAILSNVPVIHVFSPLSWLSMCIYAILSGKNSEFLLAILPIVFYLLFCFFLLNRIVLVEDNVLKGYTSPPPSSLFKFFQNLFGSFFPGKKRQLATLLFIEDWKTKRPIKFLLTSLLIIFCLILLTTNSLVGQFLAQFFAATQAPQAVALVIYITSTTMPLVPLIHNEIGYSFFNLKDRRFSFFRSTPVGIRPIAQIRLLFLFLWQVPALLFVGIVGITLDYSPILAIPLALGAGMLVTTIDYGLQCYRPQFYILQRQFEGIGLTLIILGIVNSVLLSPFLLPLDIVHSILSIGLYLICTIVISVLLIEKGVQKLEKMEFLI
ncbi:MAG: hypothetical protein ACFFDI_06355 [Promethearchaeota archaeon]